MSGQALLRHRRRIYLLRHAEALYFDGQGRPLDPRYVGLSERGVEQATSVARALAGVTLDRAVCSGMPRTRQTAELALAGRELEIADQPAFKEIRAGRLREVPAADLEAVLARAYDAAADPGACFIGGESFAEFEGRVLGAFQALLAEPGWRSLLIVSHDAVNRVLLGWASGLGLRGMAAFEQDTACLNLIDADGEGTQIRRRFIRLSNYTAYDPVKGELQLNSMERIYLAYRPQGECP